VFFACSLLGYTQDSALDRFLTPSDTFSRVRFRTLAIGGSAAYAAAASGLYVLWYRDYELGRFRVFDDWGEWNQMDKYSHALTAYAYSSLAYQGVRWSGVKPRSAAWISAGVSTFLQTTLEVMDGFSTGWGFSLGDVGANTLGTGTFLAQELLWEEQRLQFKFSSSRPAYDRNFMVQGSPQGVLSLREVAHRFYGRSFFETLLKDYNATTIWLSANPSSFMSLSENNRFPRWLNVAVGVGTNNVFGAYGNGGYRDAQGNVYTVNLPRYRQWYLSLDVDLRKIKTRKPLVKTLLFCLNSVKFPAPALEYNTLGQTKFHWLYW
jgi:Predicted periplasmic lipoprotein (DUF2279)